MAKPAISPELAELRRDLNEWRAQPDRAWTIPARFWSRAVDLAASEGVAQVVYRLGLNKPRLEHFIAQNQVPTAPAGAGFVPITLVPTEPGHAGRLVVDIQAADGDQLRLELSAHSGRDVAGLVSEFLGRPR